MAILAGSLLVQSCLLSDKSRVRSFLPRKMQGEIAGTEWVYRHAYIDPTVETPKEDDFVFVFLPFKPKNSCPKESEIPADAKTIMVSAPKRKRMTKLKAGSPRTLMFQSEASPKGASATRGRFRLTRIGRKGVVGKVVAHYDGDNWVNGRFRARMCSFLDLRSVGR